MDFVTYRPINSKYAASEVICGKYSTPVWFQRRWDKGIYAEYIRKNGCGHCCTAMAARLYGVDIDPYREYELCRKLWGAPNENGNPAQYHFMSIGGIVKILKHLGIKAESFGVAENGGKKAAENIADALRKGKKAVFWSHPSEEFPGNPFSKGEHYVLAAGIAEDSRILIANSSEKQTDTGIQLVTTDIIAKALFGGSMRETKPGASLIILKAAPDMR